MTDDQMPNERTMEREETVRHAAGRWQRHLAELGGRNSLLWQRDDGSVELDLTSAHPAGVAKLLSGRDALLSEIMREPHAYEAAYERALAIRDLSRELFEERGIISCFLALGRATWTMNSDAVPAAPILLRQCEIHLGGRHGEDLVFEVAHNVEINAALSTYLASRGVNIDQEYLASLASGPHGFDPAPTFEMMRRAGASIPGFHIEDHLAVSTYSYPKLAMVRDIAEQQASLHNHPIIAAMAGDEPSITEVSEELPAPALDADPRDEHLVLEANSAQEAAVASVLEGQSVVIMGPPGTGKSQTIANLIAALAAQGKSALFVSEKRAAIETVMARLSSVGLDNLILDAHVGSGSPSELVQELARRLVTAPESGAPHVADALRRSTTQIAAMRVGGQPGILDTVEGERHNLLEHVRALHRIRDPFGVSADDAQAAIAHLNTSANPPRSRVRLTGSALARLNVDARDETQRILLNLARNGAWRTDGNPDPWFGARVHEGDDMRETQRIIDDLSNGGFADYCRALERACEAAYLKVPGSVAEATGVLQLMGEVGETLNVFSPALFDGDVAEYAAAAAERGQSGAALGVLERRRLLKEARACLLPGRPPADLHLALERAADQQRRWRELKTDSIPSAPEGLNQLRVAHAQVVSDLEWIDFRTTETEGDHGLVRMPLESVAARIGELADDAERLAVLPAVGPDIELLRSQGLGPVIDDFAARGLDESRVEAEWEFIWWTSVLGQVRRNDPAYEHHHGDELRHSVSRFAQADATYLNEASTRVAKRVYDRIDMIAQRAPEQVEAVETALVFGGHAGSARALRQAFAGAPDLMTALAPCWAMSPLVVAQAVPAGKMFDVVIFDEASQVPPAEAISAISRAGQVVVAGDSEQLTPSSFFQQAGQSGQESPHIGTSMLDQLSQILPVRELTWHYRSQDERLIAFSNQVIYGGKLITFPRAKVDNVLRLHVAQPPAPYPGSIQVPDPMSAEIREVVALVREHAHGRPQETLGVVSLGLQHARRLEQEILHAAANDAVLADYLIAHPQTPFFVKSLERVQGDERDAIILSLGIDPTAPGGLVRQFGALNHVGGERRLNVAITRARQRMDVVSSFAGEDVDPDTLRSGGARMLRDYLLYVAECDARIDTDDAKDGVAVVGGKRRMVATSGSVALRRLGEPEEEPLPYLMEDLARRLRSAGLSVHTNFGHSSQRVEIAIEHPLDPGRMLLAVESDGPKYAAMGSVRERDRLRAQTLGGLGWAHDRVWNIDLFRDPARDANRIVDLVAELANSDLRS